MRAFGHFCVTLLFAMAFLKGPCARAGDSNLTRMVTIRVSVPDGSGAVFLAGNLPALGPWDPRKFAMDGAGTNRTAILPAPAGAALEFKFTLGTWETVETTAAGGNVPNRSYTVPVTGEAEYFGVVAAWASGSSAARKSTATASVSVLSTNFALPQLGRTRRVWVYLPPDYATSQKAYPVFYMQDGQNVFDASTSFAGEWGVDEALDQLQSEGDWGCIVVAVDNDGRHRMAEYQPDPGQPGGGEGGRYVDFIAHTLKPYVDAHFRTQPERAHTGIAGSSLGGLVSLYAALRYPEVFGCAACFSAPYWRIPALLDLARKSEPGQPPTRFYFVCGLKEDPVPDLLSKPQQEMAETLSTRGFVLDSFARADGQHAEWFWRREFPAAYQRLFAESRKP